VWDLLCIAYFDTSRPLHGARGVSHELLVVLQGLFSDAALYRPTMEEAWRQKGLIYQGLEMERDAKETLYEADRLLETQPALPFGEIPYCL